MFVRQGDYIVLKKETSMKVVQVTLNVYVPNVTCTCGKTLELDRSKFLALNTVF